MEREGRHIPNTLEYYRRRNQFNQQDIAMLLGFSCRSIVSKWEQGAQFPTAKDLLKLTLLYQASILELYPDYMQELQVTLAQQTQAHFNHELV